MKKIKLVIDIPKDMYESIKQLKMQYPRGSAKTNQFDFYYGLLNCLKQGIPLPKGHGKLVDVEDVKDNIRKWKGYLDEDMMARINFTMDNNIPTIIEADKESN